MHRAAALRRTAAAPARGTAIFRIYSKVLTPGARAAADLLHATTMNMTMTSSMLVSISRDIADGRPCWAMLRANEYLDAADPLRKALAMRARAMLPAGAPSAQTEAVLAGGARLGDLTGNIIREQGSPRRRSRGVPSAEYFGRRFGRAQGQLRNCRGTPSSSILRRRSYALRMRMNSVELDASSPALRSGCTFFIATR